MSRLPSRKKVKRILSSFTGKLLRKPYTLYEDLRSRYKRKDGYESVIFNDGRIFNCFVLEDNEVDQYFGWYSGTSRLCRSLLERNGLIHNLNCYSGKQEIFLVDLSKRMTEKHSKKIGIPMEYVEFYKDIYFKKEKITNKVRPLPK